MLKIKTEQVIREKNVDPNRAYFLGCSERIYPQSSDYGVGRCRRIGILQASRRTSSTSKALPTKRKS